MRINYKRLHSSIKNVIKSREAAESFDLDHNLDFNGLKYPVKKEDLDMWVGKNRDYVLTIFEIDPTDGKTIVPVYPLIQPTEISNDEVNRLLHTNKENFIDLLRINKKDRSHYTVIHDLSRLLSSQINAHHGAKRFCRMCLKPFSDEEAYKNHTKNYKRECLGKFIFLSINVYG